MKKNLYYKTFHQRKNGVTLNIIALFHSIASVFKVMLQVFIKKNMGERHFSPVMAIILSLALSIAPFALGFRTNYGLSFWDVISSNPSWYLFIGIFLFFCFKRYREQRREASLFDFTRFSYSEGETLSIFENFKIKGKSANPRQIAILLEPAFFFIIGLALVLLKQQIGLVVAVASILYWYSNRAAYIEGDNFVLDIIDDKICGDYFMEDFANGNNSSKGFSPTFRWPADPNLRREIVDGIFEDGGFAVAS